MNARLFVTQETILREQVEGLVEEENEEEVAPNEGDEDVMVGAITLAAKKTERQRKKEKADKIKVHTQSYVLLHEHTFRGRFGLFHC